MRDATDVETQHQGFYIRNSDDEIATTRSMLLVKRRPAAFYGPAPAKPRGREVAAEVASLKRSGGRRGQDNSSRRNLEC